MAANSVMPPDKSGTPSKGADYPFILPKIHRPDSISRRQITITPERTE
jgi:hypothetical protein